MRLVYAKARIIYKEIEEIVKNSPVDAANCALEQIILSKSEMTQLKVELNENWDNNSSVQCHSVESNDDPYSGGYKYLEWTGDWSFTYKDDVGETRYANLEIKER